jgi:hypothetical protein
MRIFFDLEFTSFARDAKLISLGAVSECGSRTHYAELQAWQTEECSDFVKTVVIPLLEHPAEQRQPADICREDFCAWVRSFGEPIELVADSDWDWRLLQFLLGERLQLESLRSGWLEGGEGERVAFRFRQFEVGAVELVFQKAAAEMYRGRQHHALVDALALRAGVLAVEKSYEGLG